MLSAGNGLDERIVAETAEIAGEAFEIVVAHPLIGESEDVMVEPGGADVGDGLGGERAGEVDAGHARAARLAAGGDGDRHGRKVRRLVGGVNRGIWRMMRSEEHTSELQSLMRISYAVFCL